MTATIISAPPIELSRDEKEVVRLFRIMERYEKSHYLESMRWSAENFPHAPSPRLRLVSGGAS